MKTFGGIEVRSLGYSAEGKIVPKRYHRARRAQKKYAKRYGVKLVPVERAYIVFGTLYATTGYIERLKKAAGVK